MASNVHRDAMIHPHAIVEPGAVIGARTRVWAFAHVLPGVVIGDDCNICDQTFIEGNVRIGSRVTVKCGVYLWDGLTIEDDVFIGAAAAFTNDVKPRSKRYHAEYAKTLVRQGASIGANATVLGGITIGRWAMIGAGAVVTKPVRDYTLVIGVPARQVGWVCRCGERLELSEERTSRCSCCGLEFEPAGTCAGSAGADPGS